MRVPAFDKTVKWIWIAGLVIVLVVAVASRGRWYPAATALVDRTVNAFRGVPSAPVDEDDAHDRHDHDGHDHDGHDHDDHDHDGHDHDGHDHDGHDHDGHDHEGHNEETSLDLSAQAMRNIGLSKETIQPVRLSTFRRSITVPAVVVERPGRTRVQVATPMTGVVTHVHAVQGEAVEPGSLLFQIRLTHEDLVNAQTEFVRTLGELDVEEREIERLRGVTQSGAVAGKLLLDRQYARDKLSALLQAQREALRLHGLSEAQVEKIASERRLLRELQIFAPSPDGHPEDEMQLTGRFQDPDASESPAPPVDANAPHTGPMIMQALNVHKGQSVSAGETLCILSDYDALFIEGMAFEQDVSELRRASEQQWTVDAIFSRPGGQTEVVSGLQIAYLANNVDPDSRTLSFYVHLPNEIRKDRRVAGVRYIEWNYLPGQRLQLRVPVEQWPDKIVVPVEALAREGAESFVFQRNGDHFDRVPVHVEYRDQYSAVIASEGLLRVGDVIALRGAHQMQMALKNKAGGGVDPHAGHNH
ncbi:efflux RND transporter periplasmic adaptor subunit [Roseimaritima sediminicola]|uniref:efflux RND transporter periplasmic adaptor subunit n=1 Tax=Roseimaritima sediminicola TaxID=2662066 RepID=UPI001F27DCD9|nr:efflux RND transporter periplasmic adaptor subunit [Roseimaritima sediminicola]